LAIAEYAQLATKNIAYQMPDLKFEAVLFDCDGVLVDSEPITNGVLREMLAERGWAISQEECMRTFVGRALKDEVQRIEAQTGSAVTPAWLAEFADRRNAALTERVAAIPNVVDAVRDIHARYRGRIACASGADRRKVELQLRKVGLFDCFEGRIFSGYETPRSKPYPDVYLAAVAALKVDAARCAVVEDTVPGVMAGVAARATVFAYAPAGTTHVSPAQLTAAGAHRHFSDMAHLPGLVVA
jgi:HAD superfamily hydrolase (TIGR01509 family)